MIAVVIFKVPFWGGARAAIAAVMQRRVWLDANVLVLEDGAAAGGAWGMSVRATGFEPDK